MRNVKRREWLIDYSRSDWWNKVRQNDRQQCINEDQEHFTCGEKAIPREYWLIDYTREKWWDELPKYQKRKAVAREQSRIITGQRVPAPEEWLIDSGAFWWLDNAAVGEEQPEQAPQSLKKKRKKTFKAIDYFGWG